MACRRALANRRERACPSKNKRTHKSWRKKNLLSTRTWSQVRLVTAGPQRAAISHPIFPLYSPHFKARLLHCRGIPVHSRKHVLLIQMRLGSLGAMLLQSVSESPLRVGFLPSKHVVSIGSGSSSSRHTSTVPPARSTLVMLIFAKNRGVERRNIRIIGIDKILIHVYNDGSPVKLDLSLLHIYIEVLDASIYSLLMLKQKVAMVALQRKRVKVPIFYFIHLKETNAEVVERGGAKLILMLLLSCFVDFHTSVERKRLPPQKKFIEEKDPLSEKIIACKKQKRG